MKKSPSLPSQAEENSASGSTAQQTPLPSILMERNDIYTKYEECKANFRENCEYVKRNCVKDRHGSYPKHFRQHLEKVAESFHDVRGPWYSYYPMEVSHAYRREIAAILMELGMVPVFCGLVVKLLPLQLESKDDRSVLSWSMRILMNNSARSPAVGEAMLLQKKYLKAVYDFILDAAEKADKSQEEILKCALYQIYNISRLDSSLEPLQTAGFETALCRHAESPVSNFRMAALAALANIVDEDDKKEEEEASGKKKDMYRTSPKSIDFIVGKMKEASKNKTGSSDGWPFRALLELVGALAKHERNSRLLVERGCLPYLAKLANSSNVEDETVALKTLWRLALNSKNVEDMMRLKEYNLPLILHEKFRTPKDSNVQHLVYGVLVAMKKGLKKDPQYQSIVEMIEKREQVAKEESPTQQQSVHVPSLEVVQRVSHLELEPGPGTASRGDGALVCGHAGRIQVMLSYNRHHREKIREISMFLLENGFKVWLDVKDMTADTIDSMAGAVESSQVICICFSKGYQDSPYCEMEAKYALDLRKPIVPLKMENHRPSGWLGIMLSGKLYVDFTGKYPDEDMKQKLLKEVTNREEEQKKEEQKGTQDEAEKQSK